MILVIDNRAEIAQHYISVYNRDGFSSARLDIEDVDNFVTGKGPVDLASVEGILLGDCHARTNFLQRLKSKAAIPVLALLEDDSIDSLLQLFEAGADDVVRHPLHDKEVLVRMGAIRRRNRTVLQIESTGVEIFTDGRDPRVNGQVLKLPRREKRILEYLAANAGRRLTRTQVFDAVYGYDDECEFESVIDSHISKLRKKLRNSLGYDPIECQRYLGYQYVSKSRA
jgi:two-component system, OmpR family, flagellar system response regulator FtcR